MKLSLPTDLLEDVLQVEEESELADAILNEAYFAFSDEELSQARRFNEKGASPSDAYKKVLIPLLDDEGKEALAAVQVGYGLEEISPLDPYQYQADPYYQKVCKVMSKKTVIGPWTLEMKRYRPYELFVYDEVKVSPSSPFACYSPLGFFKDAFPYPALSLKGTTYMSLIPHEMNTMAEAIAKAKGNVCTMGLGMGYFAFMATEKEEVTSLTVLERDENVISLFKKVFLPLFSHPEKVHIVRVEDALDYVVKEPFDYLFADLHHDATDGLPLYIRILRKEGFAKEIDVWIEKAILSYFRRYVIALIEEESNGSSDKDYQAKETEGDRVLSALHFHLKNYELKTEEQLVSLLSDDTLKSIAATMKI